jgi:hypothetical protein
VTVGQDESIGRDDETRAVSAEFVRSAPDIDALFDINVNNRRGDTLDGTHHRLRIRIEQGGVVSRGYGRFGVFARWLYASFGVSLV